MLCNMIKNLFISSLSHFTGNAECASVNAHPCLYHLVQGPIAHTPQVWGPLARHDNNMSGTSALGHLVTKTSINQHDAYA